MADMFLILDKVKGESLDADFQDEIEIIDWTWNLQNTAPYKLTQQNAASKVNVDDITITKKVDLATVTLTRHCANGTRIDKGRILCRKNSGTDFKVEYLIIDLKDVMVKKISWSGKDGEQTVPETVILSFAHFDVTYTSQMNTGSAGPGNHFAYDIQSHTSE